MLHGVLNSANETDRDNSYGESEAKGHIKYLKDAMKIESVCIESLNRCRICVIGGGPSGLMTLRALQSLDSGRYDIVCYERHDAIGGMWNFRGLEGVDEDGMLVHSSMYYNLITNNPKYWMECPEFLFPQDDTECDDSGTSCYPSSRHVLNYLTNFANHFSLTDSIKFKSWIEWVTFDESTNKFQVTIRDLRSDVRRKYVEDFDYVIDASGHFTQPNYVSYPGEETFPGTVMHAKFFLDASRYKGKRILLVGSSFSAEDLAVKSIAGGAQKVTICYRSSPTNLTFPPGVDEKPLLTKIEGSTVRFRDGSSSEYDVIIYCTGYLYDYPYMEKSIRLSITDKKQMPLYRQVVHPNNTKLMYVGVQNLAYTFPLFWLQGHLCAQIINGVSVHG
ncbi:trimethylamine monooxygenase-like isoform X1 [Convolutriloba macropyga]|uniref:trimethylamine monooxygenase-like isoform X1 n=1 Tax=Convolutriloba macropyga TaxID=536237 RepID=UPI003F51D9FD